MTRRHYRGPAISPTRVVTPRDTDEVAAVVRAALARNTTVKAIGAGHSFSAIAATDAMLIDTRHLRGLIATDVPRGQVTLGAGTHLYEVPSLIDPLGLAMPNLGDIDRQTLAGAVSTSTHGTGVGFGGLATQVIGATMVTGTGDTLRIGSHDGRLLAAIAPGLGALGVLVDITLQCVPAFDLSAVEEIADFDSAVADFGTRIREVDHHEFYWFPHTDVVQTKSNTRMTPDRARRTGGGVSGFINDEVVSNAAFGALCAVSSMMPALTAPLARVAGRVASGREFTDRSDRVFTAPRRVHFREMEYALPLEQVPDAIGEVRALIERRGYRVSFPIEVRATAADDRMMSTAYGRETGYIAVHRYHRDRDHAYFRDVEDVMIGRGGRPHWGKMHTCDARQLRAVYPRFDEFCSIREELDPHRVFTNPFLTTVLDGV